MLFQKRNKENEGRIYQITVSTQASKCLMRIISDEFVEYLTVARDIKMKMRHQNKGTLIALSPFCSPEERDVSHLSLHSLPTGTIVVIVQIVSWFKINLHRRMSKLKLPSDSCARLLASPIYLLASVSTGNGRNFLWHIFSTLQIAERDG